MLKRLFFLLLFALASGEANCQLNVHEKLRMLKPLVAKVKANPNDDAACQELLDAARIQMTFDSNNPNDVAALKETVQLLNSLPEPCASSAASNQQGTTTSASPGVTTGLSEREVQEAVNQLNAGFQAGYQNYTAEIAELQTQIGPAQQEKHAAEENLQNTVNESLESVLLGMQESDNPTLPTPPTKEEILASFQLPPHGGYHVVLFEDSLVRIEADLQLIKSLKCISTSSTRGLGPYGCFHYNLEVKLYRKLKRNLTISGAFTCAFGFEEDAFDPFDCLKDEEGYWNRFYYTTTNEPWPIANSDIIVFSNHFWTTVPSPPVKWEFKYN